MRLRAIAGNAVLTMVVSSVCMKKPAATIHNMAFCEDWLVIWYVSRQVPAIRGNHR